MTVANPVLQRLVDERTQANEADRQDPGLGNEEERDPSESERELIGRYRTAADRAGAADRRAARARGDPRQGGDARAALSRCRRQAPEPTPATATTTAARAARGQVPHVRPVRPRRDPDPLRTTSAPPSTRACASGPRSGCSGPSKTVLTTDVPGLIRPEYIAQIMQVISRDRPLVSSARMLPLTSGSIQYPRITARPTVAEQVTQKTEVGVGTMTVAMQTKAAKTFLSSANFSWQTVQWSSPGRARAVVRPLRGRLRQEDGRGARGAPGRGRRDADRVGAEHARGLDGRCLCRGRRASTPRPAAVPTRSTRTSRPATGSSAWSRRRRRSSWRPGAANLAAGTYPSIGGLQLVISTQLAGRPHRRRRLERDPLRRDGRRAGRAAHGGAVDRRPRGRHHRRLCLRARRGRWRSRSCTPERRKP